MKTIKEIDNTKFRVPISELKPGDNYKNVSEESIRKLKDSLLQDGQLNPLLVDARQEKQGNILGGNHQYFAIKELVSEEKWQYGDMVWIEPVKPENDAHAKVLALKHNTQYDLATTEQVTEWAYDLIDSDYSLSDFPVLTSDDFETISLLDLMDRVGPDGADVVEDDAPEASTEEEVSKLGEVYQLGRHRLMCGDSTKIEDVEKLMNGQKADMVFTDPPYGVEFQSNMRTKSDKFGVLKNDDSFISDWLSPALTFSTGWFLFCTSWKVLEEWLRIGKNIGELSNMIIWNKGGGGIGDLDHTLSTDFEIILAYNRGNKIHGKRIGSVWDISKDDASSYNHPTQKPVTLPATAIKHLSNGSVLDLFGGSGSTLIACEQLDRTCYMMELDPKYCDVIRKRYAKFVGKEDSWELETASVRNA